MIKRLRFGRRWLVASVLVVAVVAAGGAYAGHQDSGVTSYTGCLNISGDSAGNVLRIKEGNAPLKPCGSGQMQIHLSGGDISAVRTPTGSGLSGGSENGAVTLGLGAGQKLPSCSDGQVVKSSSGTWICASDNDTTYSAGSGLDLSGTNFSVEPSYQLPQGCGNEQVAKSDGSGTWNCANDLNSGFPPAFENEADGGVIDIDPQATVLSKTVPTSGIYLIVGKVVLFNQDDDFQTSFCQLRINGASVIDESVERNAPTDPGASLGTIDPDGTIALVEVITLGAGDIVSVLCGGFDHWAGHRQLAIVRVGSLG